MSNRVAVITGGAGLLGKEHAKALLELGQDVVIIDVNDWALRSATEYLRSEFPHSIIEAICCDITVEDQIRSAVSQIVDRFRTIDILINNAAKNPVPTGNLDLANSEFENFELDSWNSEIAVGLTGAFLTSKYVSKIMRNNLSGIILNISSDLSVISPDQRIYLDEFDHQTFFKPVTYSVVKSGLIGFTRYLATYLAPFNIRVNALSPGGVEDGQSSTFIEKLTERIPMGRMAKKFEYRGAIQFLCSNQSSYMTGQNIIIDGGRTVW